MNPYATAEIGVGNVTGESNIAIILKYCVRGYVEMSATLLSPGRLHRCTGNRKPWETAIPDCLTAYHQGGDELRG